MNKERSTKSIVFSILLLLSALAFFPPAFELLYHEIGLPYFRTLLICCSFSFFGLFLLQVFRKTKGFFLVLLNAFILLIFLCFAEFFFYFMNQGSETRQQYNTDVRTKNHSPLTQPDDVLGHSLKANLDHLSTLEIGGKNIYSSLIHSDSLGHRKTPFDSTKNKQAIFLGCSFTFGEGLNDEQTLPWLCAQNSEYNTLNLACVGYGPQQALLQMRSLHLTPDKETKVIYVYIDGHIQRVNGFLSVVNSYGKDFPYPQLEDNSLVMYPSFSEKSPALASLYAALKDCQTMQYFNTNLPLFTQERHYELFGKTIEELAREVKKKYNNELVILIYPGSEQHNEVLEHVNINLIQVLDYSSLCTKGDEKYFFPKDGHPNALVNQMIARRILKELFNINRN
ncbi:MAG: hypothetical protein ACKOXB_11830 [Flavobacteriales bacterium]